MIVNKILKKVVFNPHTGDNQPYVQMECRVASLFGRVALFGIIGAASAPNIPPAVRGTDAEKPLSAAARLSPIAR